MTKMRKTSSDGQHKPNKYANLKSSEQKNSAGQRRVRREAARRAQ